MLTEVKEKNGDDKLKEKDINKLLKKEKSAFTKFVNPKYIDLLKAEEDDFTAKFRPCIEKSFAEANKLKGEL